jgi:hypothetical protein
MSSTDRQNRLLLAEDWKTVYQSFKYADFKSYDFDNLRRTMIEYLRENYPEDFNDYIESSEYLALIDMIAFLGQNISFRIDLNARENFIELAERKESVLRLANLLSYNATRNRPAQGLLKFSSVRTSEQVTDSNGFNLANRSVIWNDTTNPDWFEQFTKILNAGLPVQNTFGTPVKSDSVAGVATEQYRLNNISNNVSVFTFSKPVNSRTLEFEIVSTGIENGEVLEEAPLPGSQFSFLYRDNGQGPGSNTTGFFAQFRQGTLQRGDFNIDSAVPNQKVDIDAENINQTDVWLYKLDSNGREGELWNKVDAVEGNNVVFNSLNKKIRSIYSVLTRSRDRVSLVFADGIFGDLPKGKFRSYYRTSSNSDYTILPPNMTNVTVRIPYLSNANKPETLTVTLDLKVAVNNAASTETIDSIKSNAPSTYYTQNRLITAEDYNVGPLGISQDIIKVKAVNRTASGISRNYDILDATGKYSNTNLFGTDGVLYKENIENKTTFKFRTRTDIESEVENTITNILQNKNVKNFYLSEYFNQNYAESNLSWNSVTSSTNRSTGLIKDNNGIIYTIGSFTEGPLKFFEIGAMVKFIPPAGSVFLNEKLTTDLTAPGTKSYMWSKVISVSATGTEILDSGLGPIVFNDVIPDGSILNEIKPKFVKELTDSVKLQIIDNAFAYRTFGLRYDRNSRAWALITQENLNIIQDFNLGLSGDDSGQQIDSSWVVLFETNGTTYDVTYRTTRYIFESDTEVRFYFDSAKKIYDSKTGKVIRDKISILSINTDVNTAPGTAAFTRNFEWEISSEYRDASGYVDSKKIEVTFFDSDDDGVVDDPDIFENVVNLNNYVFTKKSVINNSQFEVYVNSVDENIVTVSNSGLVDVQAIGNPIYYIVADNIFRQLNSQTRLLTTLYDYKSYIGREELKFQYNHVTDENTRIDPSSTNIIDTYILTRQYDTIFRQYLNNIVIDRPLPPSSDQLFRSYGSEINKIKSISDEVIYQPVKYRVLFGNKSEPAMQAVFKIVKNSTRVVNDNDLKSRVISAINNFFALDNWDFGETFYWSELSAYVMKELSPDLSSIIIVPRDSLSSFGSLFEIKLESDEIFISSAVVDDVEVITAITAERLKSEGAIVTSAPDTNTGIQSATGTTSTNTGGFIY